MIVIPKLTPRQSSIRVLLALLASCTLWPAPATAETHANLQAVTATGTSAWTPAYPVTLTGVLLTDPDEMLDATPNFQPASAGVMGGEWQVVVQAAWPGDRGGTTCWMGQNYATRRAPGDDSFSYSNEAWLAEVSRINHDPATGHAFKKGDLIAISANGSLFYGGKRNVNEMHHNEADYDFTVTLITTNYGLPSPEVISLASLVRTNDNDAATSEEIFDATRQAGGEHWQGMRVRINGLMLAASAGWDATKSWNERRCSVTDGENRFFTLRHPRYSLGAAPTNWFDAIGVLSQESGSGSQGTNGYELFVQEVVPSSAAELAVHARPVITWPGALANYQLQYRPTADQSETWMPATNTPVCIEGKWTVILDPAAEKGRLYRLHRIQ